MPSQVLGNIVHPLQSLRKECKSKLAAAKEKCIAAWNYVVQGSPEKLEKMRQAHEFDTYSLLREIIGGPITKGVYRTLNHSRHSRHGWIKSVPPYGEDLFMVSERELDFLYWIYDRLRRSYVLAKFFRQPIDPCFEPKFFCFCGMRYPVIKYGIEDFKTGHVTKAVAHVVARLDDEVVVMATGTSGLVVAFGKIDLDKEEESIKAVEERLMAHRYFLY